MSIFSALKTLTIVSISAIILGIGGWLGLRSIAIYSAQHQTQHITQAAQDHHARVRAHTGKSDEDQKIIAMTRAVHEHFTHQESASSWLYRLRPYLTNARLPDFIRLPSGVVEAHIQSGLCDNAARLLAFMLRQDHIRSTQWNMVTNQNGHSGLEIHMPDGRKIYVDPFFGYVAMDSRDRLTHITHLQSNPTGTVLKPLNPDDSKNANAEKFYRQIRGMRMAAEGQPLTLRYTIPALDDAALSIGAVNNTFTDVMRDGNINGIGPYWGYIGHKYNREWVRVLTAQRPLRIEMTLLSPAEHGVITATPAPSIDGKTLRWDLGANEQLTFRDGAAHLSLKRLNSYIGVDQITFSPL